MATHRLWIPATAFLPDTSANCYPKSSLVDDANDLMPHEILAFKDGSTRIAASTTFGVPKNYVGSAAFFVVWRSTATSGAVVWDVDTVAVADGETLDPSATTDSLTVTTTTPGTARLRKDSQPVTVSGTYAADDLVLLKVARDCSEVADTMAAEALFEGMFFQYADA